MRTCSRVEKSRHFEGYILHDLSIMWLTKKGNRIMSTSQVSYLIFIICYLVLSFASKKVNIVVSVHLHILRLVLLLCCDCEKLSVVAQGSALGTNCAGLVLGTLNWSLVDIRHSSVGKWIIASEHLKFAIDNNTTAIWL